MGAIMSQKEASPLSRFARNSLPHKSHRFCSPMRKKWSHILVNSFCCPTLHGSLRSPCNVTHQKPMPVIAFPVSGFSTVFYRNGIRYMEPSLYTRPRIWIRSLRSLSKFFTRLGAYARAANPIPLLVSL